MIPVPIKCVFCDNEFVVEVDNGDYRNWKSGTHIQDAMPYLTPDERELLITGTCGPCWDIEIPDDEETE